MDHTNSKRYDSDEIRMVIERLYPDDVGQVPEVREDMIAYVMKHAVNPRNVPDMALAATCLSIFLAELFGDTAGKIGAIDKFISSLEDMRGLVQKYGYLGAISPR